jgi:hypothetical protein
VARQFIIRKQPFSTVNLLISFVCFGLLAFYRPHTFVTKRKRSRVGRGDGSGDDFAGIGRSLGLILPRGAGDVNASACCGTDGGEGANGGTWPVW